MNLKKKELVILVGGRGSRLGNLTKKIPKPMMKVNKKYFLEYIIEYAAQFGFTDIYLIGYYKFNFIKKNIKKKYFNSKIHFLKELKPMDTGGALLTIKNKIKSKRFVLINGDTFFKINYDKFFNSAKKNKKIINMCLVNNKNYKSNKKLNQLGINSKGIVCYKQKSYLSNSGYYVLHKKILKFLKANKKISLENDLIPTLINQKKISAEISKDVIIDIGLKKNLKKSNKILKKAFGLKTFFLDRDGVINYNYGYVGSLKKFKFLPDTLKFLRYISKKNYLIIIITNQSGIGRGYYKIQDMNKIHSFMKNFFLKENIIINDIFYCPHKPDDNCFCRKPRNELIIKAVKKWNIDISRSYFIGDSFSDLKCATKSKITFFWRKENMLSILKNKIN